MQTVKKLRTRRFRATLERGGGSKRDARAGTINGVSDFADTYRPTEEHEAFRAAIREVCEEKVAPNAAEADEVSELPKASFEAHNLTHVLPILPWCPGAIDETHAIHADLYPDRA